MDRQQKLLKSYIKLLVEDGETGTGSYGAGGYYSMVEPGGLFAVVSGPLKNVFKVAEGEGKKVLSTAKLAIKLTVGSLANLIPGVNIKLKNALSVHKKEVSEIEKQYKQFYDSALGANKDIKLAAFLWNPSLFLAGKVSMGAARGAAAAPKKIADFFRSSSSSNTRTEGRLFTEEAKEEKENLESPPSRLMSISRSYKNSFEENTKKIFSEMEELKKMNDQAFIKKYASSLGDNAKLYNDAEKQLEKAQKDKVDSSTANAKEAIKLIEDKKQEIVKQGKNAIFDLYIKAFEDQKKQIINSVQQLSGQWKVSVDPKKHGQIIIIDNIIEKMKKIKSGGS